MRTLTKISHPGWIVLDVSLMRQWDRYFAGRA